MPELGNASVCDKFKPFLLDGQLCYSLDFARYAKIPAKVGKRNGLLLLVDHNPYGIKSSGRNYEAQLNDEQSFKVYIHTLAQHTAYGPGAYGMNALKSMTGKDSFLQLSDDQKKCRVHNREECQTAKFLEQVNTNCNCVPWSLEKDTKAKVGTFRFYEK